MGNENESAADRLAVLRAQLVIAHEEERLARQAVREDEARIRAQYPLAVALLIIERSRREGDRATRQSLIDAGQDPDHANFRDLYHDRDTRGQQ